MGIEKKTIRHWIEQIGMGKLILIIVCGIVLLLLSLPGTEGEEKESDTKKEDSTKVEEYSTAMDVMDEYAQDMEEKTAKLLEKAEGVGNVKVMVTLAASQEKVTLQDDDVSKEEVAEGDSGGGKRTTKKEQGKNETVIVQEDGKQQPYVVQMQSPEIEGIVVVAQGAESVEVKREIIEAIQALFPIEAHKIKVMKMK